MPLKSLAMRESSGPGSEEALDLLDRIYPTKVQAAGHTNVVGATPCAEEDGAVVGDGPGGLVSVPENDQLSHAQFLAVNVDTSHISAHDTTPSMNEARTSDIPPSVPAALESSTDLPSLIANHTEDAPEVDVFGPTSSARPPTKRSSSSSSMPKRNASDTVKGSGIGKPLPGLPPGPSVAKSENTFLPIKAQHATTQQSDNTLQALQKVPAAVPLQHIPRPINTSSRNSVNDEHSGGTASRLSTPPQRRQSVSRDPGASLQSPASPDLATNPGRSLAEIDRSSIDDIRRLHAQRAARNLELAAGTSELPAISHARSGGHPARPFSVIESRSKDAAMATAALTASVSKDSAYSRPMSSEGPKSSRSGSGNGMAGNAPIMGQDREVERQRERDRENRDRDREREKERERRTRRTLGDYALGKTLGAGSMGKVKLGVKMGNGEKVAIKIIPRHTSLAAAQHLKQQQQQGSEKPAPPPTASFLAKAAAKDHSKEVRTIREGSLQLLLHHPYVCGMKEMIIHPNHYYMIFEYVNGGQMLDYIISHGRLRERAARKFARQIGSALEYCHRNSIVHRDLKIENILISKTGNIKIIDFGLSNLFSPHSNLSTFCGSLYFAAPELLNAKAYIGPEVDVWSFGIVLYVLVCGKVPFDDQSMPALHAKIKKGQVEYPAWLSGECKHILSRMLVTNPQQRATLPEILAHPWMVKGYDGAPNAHLAARQPLRPQTLDPEVVKGMTGFEFGTPEDIESRLLEVLTGDAYQNALHAWDTKAKSAMSSAQSASNSASGSSTDILFSPLNRAGTRNSIDSKVKSGSKRFSGLDFYRKKISTTTLFGSKESDGNAYSSNGTLNGNGSAGNSWQGRGKEVLDPTRGFHPLLSIYYLVSEKMEREKLYGHSFFASSNVSLNGGSAVNTGPVASQTTTTKQGIPLDGSGGSSSMPTAADIPQEALQIPEISHVATASRREGPVSTLPAPPPSARSAGFTSPTPVFDSREKSQPMPIMAGPPRARALGDEVETTLRDKGYTAPVSTSWNPPSAGAEQRMSTSVRNSTIGSTATTTSNNNHERDLSQISRSKQQFSNETHQGSLQLAASQAQSQSSSQKQQLPLLPSENDEAEFPNQANRKNSVSPDKRRVFHGLMTPRAETPTGIPGTAQGEGNGESTFLQGGSSFVRRFGSLIGRSPSTPVDLDGREKRRLARMSTGVVSSAPTAPAASRNGTAQGGLTGVEESRGGESAAVVSGGQGERRGDGAGDRSSPVQGQHISRVADAGDVKRSGTVHEYGNQRRDSYQKGTKPAASMGRASGGHQLATLSATRRPSTGTELAANEASLSTAPPHFNGQQNGMNTAQNDALFARHSGSGNGAQRSATLHVGGRDSKNYNRNSVALDRDREMHSSKPIFLKGLFSVQTTSTKPRAVLHADLVRVFDRIGLQYRELKGGYECVHLPSLDFSQNGALSGVGSVSGRGNARIIQEDEMVGSEYQVNSGGISSNDYQTGGDYDATITPGMRPRKKASRMSFVSSSKKEKQKRKEDSSTLGDSGSVGSFNNASASIGDDLESSTIPAAAAAAAANNHSHNHHRSLSHEQGAVSRSRASSVNAHPANQDGPLEQLDYGTPSHVASSKMPRSRTDSLGAPSFMQSPNASPVSQFKKASSPVNNASSAITPTTDTKMVMATNSSALELAVRFEIYVVKVPLLLGVNGLQFRRISGNPWQYQQLARRVLQELKL
ncbi:hypothetical protein CBS101457_006329 [Exobasidium rhododendri]|nr:hypothetical protein CBS101457_006329 [Exobasidium rhododendri]